MTKSSLDILTPGEDSSFFSTHSIEAMTKEYTVLYVFQFIYLPFSLTHQIDKLRKSNFHRHNPYTNINVCI